MPLTGEVRREEVIWLLGSLSGLYRIPFDAALIAQQFPPPYTVATFHEAARSLGLKTGTRNIADLDWQKLPLPAIAFLRAVPAPDAAETEGPPPSSAVLILKTDGHKLLYFRDRKSVV